MKTSNASRFFKAFAGLVIGLGLAIGLALPMATKVRAQSVVQAYAAGSSLQTGMIVRLGADTTVEPVSAAAVADTFGVVISPSEADVTLSSGSTSQQAYVATSGTYEVLVSNQNGPIQNGDYITVSSIDGIGMKAGTSQSTILGKASAAFDGTNNVINTSTLTTAAGKKLTVALGQIPVTISVGHNPLQQTQKPDLPNFLERIAQDTVQKQVDATRIYLSLVVLCLTALIVAVMLYSGIRNSLVAIGRNPLSKHSIFRGLSQVVVVSIVIFIVGLFAVYLLLKV